MSRKLLLVDDETDVHEIVELMLGKEGFEILSASSGDEALRMVHEEEFDVILLDLLMPGMSGKDFLRIMKRSRGSSTIPVVVFTALKPEDAYEECKKLGAAGFVHKPFAKKVLLREIERVLDEPGKGSDQPESE
jgi:DNA-binding response OmpR family regulator